MRCQDACQDDRRAAEHHREERGLKAGIRKKWGKSGMNGTFEKEAIDSSISITFVKAAIERTNTAPTFVRIFLTESATCWAWAWEPGIRSQCGWSRIILVPFSKVLTRRCCRSWSIWIVGEDYCSVPLWLFEGWLENGEWWWQWIGPSGDSDHCEEMSLQPLSGNHGFACPWS